MNKILVTGATGQLGKEVIHALLNTLPASGIAALVRDTDKASDLAVLGVDIRTGNYDQEESLIRAFEGIDKLYFVSSSELADRTEQHLRVVNAAKAAGIKHVVYTSFQRRNETATSPIALVAQSHLATEKALIASGLSYTILKHGLYMDLLPMFVGDNILETGVIYQPAGEGKTAYALRKELAEAGAAVLSGKGHENKIYELYPSTTYSYPEIATILQQITGKEIQYVSPSPEEYIQTLTAAGVQPEFTHMFAGFGEAIRQGEFEDTSKDFETLLGRRATTVESYLESCYGKR